MTKQYLNDIVVEMIASKEVDAATAIAALTIYDKAHQRYRKVENAKAEAKRNAK